MHDGVLKGWSADLGLREPAWNCGFIYPQLIRGSASSDRRPYFTWKPPAVREVDGLRPQLGVDWNMWTLCTCLNEICPAKSWGSIWLRVQWEKHVQLSFSLSLFKLGIVKLNRRLHCFGESSWKVRHQWNWCCFGRRWMESSGRRNRQLERDPWWQAVHNWLFICLQPEQQQPARKCFSHATTHVRILGI